MVQGKGSVTYFERVEYKKKDGTDVKGYIAHCQIPVEAESDSGENELLGFKVAQCWVNDENKLKIQTGSAVRVRYGKYGQYIEEVLK